VFKTMPRDGYRSRALAAVLIDRGAGFAALLTLGAGGALLNWNSNIAKAYLSIYGFGVAAGAIGLLGLNFAWFRPLTNKIRHLKAFDAIEHNVERLRKARADWVRQFGLSLAFQTTSVSLVYWLFLQTGPAVPFGQCALATAAAGMAALMPLSINGIGLMEGSFVAMSVALGVDYDHALLVAIVRRVMIAFLSLLCGIVYLAEGRGEMSSDTKRAEGSEAGE
jgi:uncharacterized membrane protein YbhN (UPF0104 family)